MRTLILMTLVMLTSAPTFADPTQNPVANPEPTTTSAPSTTMSQSINTGIDTGNGVKGTGVTTHENGVGSDNGINSGLGEHNAAAGGEGGS